MSRCIELAKNGLGSTYPNPMVGSIIVYDDTIISEGWHYKSGCAHAEVNAINNVKDLSVLTNATIYVSLEPCAHFGKTPPCVDLILKHKIPNVVIGTVDPNEKVAGKSVQKLLDAGVNVTVGILEKECQDLNKRFFTFHNQKRPYIILKWAESLDGFIAPKTQDSRNPFWLTNTISRQLVHKWRTEEQAILAGTQTIIADNPKLNSRDYFGKQPIRITIDKDLKIPKDSHIYDNQIQTIVFTEKDTNQNQENIIYKKIDFNIDTISQIIDFLYQSNIQSIIIEGGSNTIQKFIDRNIWDEARVFISAKRLENGVKSPAFHHQPADIVKIQDDTLYIYQNQ